MKRLSTPIVGTLILSSLMAGCAKEAVSPKDGQAPSEAKPQVSTEPVTLKVLYSGRQEEFNDKVNNPIIKQKLPNVDFEYHNLSEGMEKLIVSGVKIDVMNITTKVFFDALNLNLQYDISDLLSKQKFDMSRFLPEHVEIIKRLGNGKMYGVPDKANFPYAYHAMVYNKDIFDKLGVPYPKDNMTWDQVLDLAKRVNRMDSGTQYYGLGLPTAQYMYEALELNYTDAKDKVNISNPLYAKIFGVYQEAFKITGRETLGNIDPFIKEKNVAMFAGNVGVIIEEAERQKDNFPNWDIVTFPSFEENPNKVPPINGVYMVASTSEHKDEALKLIDALLAPESTKNIEKQYMNAEFSKKNINAVKSVKQSLYVPGAFDATGNALFNNKIRAMNKNNVDINTSLREMQEELQKQIDDKKK